MGQPGDVSGFFIMFFRLFRLFEVGGEGEEARPRPRHPGDREGEGQLYFRSGRIISGLWQNDVLPQGTCIEANGNRYVGQLSSECQYSGYGTLFLSNGSWAQGIWEDNVLISGRLFTDDGFIHDYQDKKVINKQLWKKK